MGGTPGTSPSRNRKKMLLKIGVILQGYIHAVKGEKSRKYLINILGKSQFSMRFLGNKSKNFLKHFQIFLHFCPNAQNFARLFLDNHAWLKLFINFYSLEFLYKLQTIFSKIFIYFPRVLQDLSQFWCVFWSISKVGNNVDRKFLWNFKMTPDKLGISNF